MCDKSGILRIILLIKNIIGIIQIAVPVILIIMCMIDIVRMIMSNMEKKAEIWKKIIHRFIAAIIFFMVPVLLNVVLAFLGQQNFQTGQCWIDANEVTIAKKKEEEIEEENRQELAKNQELESQLAYIQEALDIRRALAEEWKKNEAQGNATKIGAFPYYNQGTAPWNTVPFCSANVAMGENGCGGVSLSMITSGLTGENFNPQVTADWFCNNGHSGGALPDAMPSNGAFLDRFKVNVSILWGRGNAPSKDSVISQMTGAVNSGKALLVLIPGHFVAVTKGKDNAFSLLDPGARELTKEYDANTLYDLLYNYKGRCSNGNNCGVKAVWAYSKR